ncbi:hypothetical protein LUZ60_012248 [Juncus effusus]|nr:hypothetical protein LUZ60_012248 [Juncus effusus]
MKSTKDKSLMDLQKKDSSMGISPSKKKNKRPKPFMAFSSFARCNLFSHATPQNPKTPKTLKQIESPVDSDSELEEEEEEDQTEETIEVDFEFFDPKPNDFHGVKLLLQNYLDKFQWDLSGFVDLILAQSTVGTVVKSADSQSDNNNNNSDENNNDSDENENKQGNNNDEGEIFALISALNFHRYKEHKCIKELKQYLVSICKDGNTKDKLVKLLEEQDKYLGLLICQRFVNCPYPLVLKLYEALFDEIKWATEDEPTEEIRDSYRFKNYLLVTKIFVNNNSNNRSERRNAKRKADQNEEEPIIYVKEEDEIFREICSWSFTFELSADDPTPSDLKNYKKMGLVMVVKAEDISKFRNKFKSLVEG